MESILTSGYVVGYLVFECHFPFVANVNCSRRTCDMLEEEQNEQDEGDEEAGTSKKKKNENATVT